jgi:membrane-associated phospholipid phosphatase
VYVIGLIVLLSLADGAPSEGSPREAPKADSAPKKVEVEPVGWADYATVGVGMGLSILANALPPRAQVPAQRNAFDEAARSLVRLDSQNARFAIRDASDLTLSLVMVAPVMGDALLNVGWYHRDPRSAWRLAIVDFEAFAITGALQGVTNVLVSRERPYGRTCGADLPADADDCVWDVRYRSFYSGHSSFSFTGAALLCSRHLRHRLFGGGGAEIATCGVGFALATATALFRMMGDMHYASDVLTGAAVGTAVGFLVPAIHERVWGSSERGSGLRLAVVPSGAGVSVMGVW